MTTSINGKQTTTLVANTAGESYIINGSINTSGVAINASAAVTGRQFTINGVVKAAQGTAFQLGAASLADSDTYVHIGDVGSFLSGGKGLVALSGSVTFENTGVFHTTGNAVELRGNGNVFKNVATDKGAGRMTSDAGSVLLSYGIGDTIDNTNGAVMTAKANVIITRGEGATITNNVDSRITATVGSAIVASGDDSVIYNVGRISAVGNAIVSGDGATITNDGGAVIVSTKGRAITASGDDVTITNQGSISSLGDAIYSSGDDAAINNTATLASSGGAGIRALGDDATITNSTTVSGKTFGIYAGGDHASITNFGTVKATQVGIGIAGDDATVITRSHVTAAIAVSITGSGTTLTNYNEITGTTKGHAAIEVSSKGTTSIVNRSVIDGSVSGTAIEGGAGREHVVNVGSIEGNVILGAGNDWFSSLKGEVTGRVYGGAGNDTYVVGIPLQIRELANGGIDTVQSLYTYTLGANLENLTLIGTGTMDATGNGLANRIEGNTGNNHLTGGGGKDIFVFETGFNHDIITDFTDGQDRIDLSGYDGVSKYTDLAGKIAVSGKDIIITFSSHDVLTIEHTARSELSAADFIF